MIRSPRRSGFPRWLKPTLCLAVLLIAGSVECAGRGGSSGRVVTVADDGSDSICLRLLFDAGSACDPPGREGIAALTGYLLELRAQDRGRPAITVLVDRDVAIMTSTCPVTEWAALVERLVGALSDPVIDPARFAAARDAQSAALDSLRGTPPLLAHAALQAFLYVDHPYGHPPLGLTHTVQALTADDILAFLRTNYTRDGYLIGLVGPSPAGRARELDRALQETLPPGKPPLPELPPTTWSGLNVRLIEARDLDSAVLCVGAAIDVVRGDSAYAALSLAADHFGSSRVRVGGLDAALRGERRLTGHVDVSIEHHDNLSSGGPPPPRRRQYFAARWRTSPVNTAYTLTIALVELETLARHGMSAADLEAAVRVRADAEKRWTPCRRMNEELNERWLELHGAGRTGRADQSPPSPSSLRRALDRFFPTRDLVIVAVVPDARAFANQLLRNQLTHVYPPDVDARVLRKADQRYFSNRPQWEVGKIQLTGASEMFR